MKTMNAKNIFILLGFLLALNIIGKNAHAATPIICETAFGEKSFSIQTDRVVFSQGDEGASRSISSVDHVRTEKRHKGFDKILMKDGLKHRIHIDDTGSFSDLNDYIVVTSPKGHEMTYPLSCR